LVSWNLNFEGNAWVKSAAENDCGPGEFSDSLWIIVSDPVGVITMDPGLDFSISPNPNNGIFSITCNASENEYATIRVMNNMGQVVTSKHFMTMEGKQEVVIDVSYMNSGFYFVVFEAGNKKKTKKLLFNK
jgi:hypothetical protein